MLLGGPGEGLAGDMSQQTERFLDVSGGAGAQRSEWLRVARPIQIQNLRLFLRHSGSGNSGKFLVKVMVNFW